MNDSKKSDPLDTVYSGWAGKFSKVYSELTESPRSFFFMAALTCLGVILSGRVTLASSISPQPRLFLLLLGESADDRKSTAIKFVVDFFKEAIEKFFVCYGVGSAEGLAIQFKGSNKVLLVFDEFKSFVSKAKIETSILLQTVNSLFEDNRFHSATKKRKIEIDNGHLAVLSASTVETYSNIYDPQFLDIGFVNRLFVIKDHGEKKFAIPKKIEESAKKELKEELKELLTHVMSNAGLIELEVTPEAETLFESWYFNLPRTQSAKRLDTYGHRLMILLCINNGKTKVDIETARRVITLLDYELQVREEVDPIDADNRIAQMEAKIRKAIKMPLKPRELKKRVHYERCGISIYNMALSNLMSEGEINYDPKTKTYRKGED